MRNLFKSACLFGLVGFSMSLFATPATALPNGWGWNTVTCNNGDKHGWFGDPAKAQEMAQIYCGGDVGSLTSGPVRGPFVLTSAVSLPVRAMDVVDLNAVTDVRTAEAVGINPATLAAINEVRTRGEFVNAEDFATRVCDRTSVSIRTGAIRIGTTEYRTQVPRDVRRPAPRPGPIFSCVAGSGTYDLVGRAHNYVGHVTLLR